MSLKERWGILTQTEKFFIGSAIVLIILIATRWDYISDKVAESFKRIFSTHSTE